MEKASGLGARASGVAESVAGRRYDMYYVRNSTDYTHSHFRGVTGSV